MADRSQKRRIDLLHQVLHSHFEEQERELQIFEQQHAIQKRKHLHLATPLPLEISLPFRSPLAMRDRT